MKMVMDAKENLKIADPKKISITGKEVSFKLEHPLSHHHFRQTHVEHAITHEKPMLTGFNPDFLRDHKKHGNLEMGINVNVFSEESEEGSGIVLDEVGVDAKYRF